MTDCLPVLTQLPQFATSARGEDVRVLSYSSGDFLMARLCSDPEQQSCFGVAGTI